MTGETVEHQQQISVKTRKGSSNKVKQYLSSLFFGYFSYSTTREFKADTFYVAFIFRILQLAIVLYVVGWDLIKNQSYQSFDPVSSTITTKVKGLGYTKSNASSNRTNRFLGERVLIDPSKSYRMFDVISWKFLLIFFNTFN